MTVLPSVWILNLQRIIVEIRIGKKNSNFPRIVCWFGLLIRVSLLITVTRQMR